MVKSRRFAQSGQNDADLTRRWSQLILCKPIMSIVKGQCDHFDWLRLCWAHRNGDAALTEEGFKDNCLALWLQATLGLKPHEFDPYNRRPQDKTWESRLRRLNEGHQAWLRKISLPARMKVGDIEFTKLTSPALEAAVRDLMCQWPSFSDGMAEGDWLFGLDLFLTSAPLVVMEPQSSSYLQKCRGRFVNLSLDDFLKLAAECRRHAGDRYQPPRPADIENKELLRKVAMFVPFDSDFFTDFVRRRLPGRNLGDHYAKAMEVLDFIANARRKDPVIPLDVYRHEQSLRDNDEMTPSAESGVQPTSFAET